MGKGITFLEKRRWYTNFRFRNNKIVSKPVINLACAIQHPTQALADIVVVHESLGNLKGKKLVARWVYSPIVRQYTSIQADGLITATLWHGC